jgi:hypothetical protein
MIRLELDVRAACSRLLTPLAPRAIEEQQDPTLLFEAWREAGITEVRVAGEYSYNFTDQTPACLGRTTLTLLEAGFDVRGIEGAIYPPQAPSKFRNTDVASALFSDPAPLS